MYLDVPRHTRIKFRLKLKLNTIIFLTTAQTRIFKFKMLLYVLGSRSFNCSVSDNIYFFYLFSPALYTAIMRRCQCPLYSVPLRATAALLKALINPLSS